MTKVEYLLEISIGVNFYVKFLSFIGYLNELLKVKQSCLTIFFIRIDELIMYYLIELFI